MQWHQLDRYCNERKVSFDPCGVTKERLRGGGGGWRRRRRRCGGGAKLQPPPSFHLNEFI